MQNSTLCQLLGIEFKGVPRCDEAAITRAIQALSWKPIANAPEGKELVLFNQQYFMGHGGFEFGRWRQPKDGDNRGFTLFFEPPELPAGARMTEEERAKFNKLPQREEVPDAE